MSNLYKKINIGILAAILSLGGCLSNVLVINANSSQGLSKYELSGPRELSDIQKKANKENNQDEKDKNELLIGEQQFGYKILYYNLSKDDVKFFSDIFQDLSSPYKYFDNGLYFRIYLWERGMNQGFYRFKIGDLDALIQFEKNIPPGIYWGDYDNVDSKLLL